MLLTSPSKKAREMALARIGGVGHQDLIAGIDEHACREFLAISGDHRTGSLCAKPPASVSVPPGAGL
jgi:hypothetical protein